MNPANSFKYTVFSKNKDSMDWDTIYKSKELNKLFLSLLFSHILFFSFCYSFSFFLPSSTLYNTHLYRNNFNQYTVTKVILASFIKIWIKLLCLYCANCKQKMTCANILPCQPCMQPTNKGFLYET